jgi:hypothetical protein
MRGQVRDVAVYRLIAAGTLEELIYTRQLYKQQQAAVAIEGAAEDRYFQGAPALCLAGCATLLSLLFAHGRLCDAVFPALFPRPGCVTLFSCPFSTAWLCNAVFQPFFNGLVV